MICVASNSGFSVKECNFFFNRIFRETLLYFEFITVKEIYVE